MRCDLRQIQLEELECARRLCHPAAIRFNAYVLRERLSVTHAVKPQTGMGSLLFRPAPFKAQSCAFRCSFHRRMRLSLVAQAGRSPRGCAMHSYTDDPPTVRFERPLPLHPLIDPETGDVDLSLWLPWNSNQVRTIFAVHRAIRLFFLHSLDEIATALATRPSIPNPTAYRLYALDCHRLPMPY